MPVFKYSGVEDMPDWNWYEPGDARLWQALRNLHRMYQVTHPRPRRPPGVYKYRSIEDAERANDSWAATAPPAPPATPARGPA
jgi:hypothetical protein